MGLPAGLRPGREAVAGEAPYRMNLVTEDVGLDRGIAIHDPRSLAGRGVENPDACPFTVVSDRAHNPQYAVSPERMVAATMFPDDRARLWLVVPGCPLEQHERVRPRLSLYLAHVFVGDNRHC